MTNAPWRGPQVKPVNMATDQLEEPLIHASVPFDSATDVDQPDLATLREAIVNRAHQVSPGPSIKQDAVAGLNSALSSVPDGMASGYLQA